MKRFAKISCLVLTVFSHTSIFATDLPQLVEGHDSVYHGGNAEFSKTGTDSILLIGPWDSDAPVNGQFQDPSGSPAWNGWTHKDVTQQTESHWHVSNYAAGNLPGGSGNLAAFCGNDTYPSCDPLDPTGGYGNSYNEIIEFSYAVTEASTGCTMTVDGVFNSNTEPGYDYVTFQFETASSFVAAAAFDGVHQSEQFLFSLDYDPADYVGENNDEVRFQIVVTSDGIGSDEDCSYWWGDGACQIDDLRVQCTNGNYDVTTDFQDGTFGVWEVAFPRGVGDFTGLWVGLEDYDPCHTNYSPQVAFINDGTQVPGVEGSPCMSWCYGPGGYIVNTTGGATDYGHIFNVVESPVIAWPGSEYIGAELTFGVYRHEDLSAESPNIFYTWEVRSTTDEATMPIASQPWVSRSFLYYGGPEYIRPEIEFSDLLEPGTTHVQVQLGCKQLPMAWNGHNGYPAPYFDNVRLKASMAHGPSLSTSEINLAQDNFTASGEEVDLDNLAANNVRFDAVLSKATAGEEHNIPGDSITCDVVSVRSGGELVSNRLVYTMERNPVFDSVRDPQWGISGHTDGIRQGTTDRYFYDLPDSGFLFPGDILHYYFEAADEVDHTDSQTATIPVDLTSFGDFSKPNAYDTNFQVHALPSIRSYGNQPEILFWNDSGNSDGEEDWFMVLDELGFTWGVHYDVFYTHGPTSGLGNGLGGRAVYDQIKGYTDLLYTSGDLANYTICSGDFYSGSGRDVQLLTDWFTSEDGRDAFFCGDGLAWDMHCSGSLTSDFLRDFMNVEVVAHNLKPLINNQSTPVVLPVPGNSVFYTTDSWMAYGGCPVINTFDAVAAGAGAERLARFTNPSGNPAYDYSAATSNMTGNNRIVTMPYDFMSIAPDPENPVYGRSIRARILKEILAFFQQQGVIHPPSSVPDGGRFFANSYPNPFNPATRIEFNLPKAGHLTLKIYNVRGELVKTLIDEPREAGTDHIMWDGTNSQGSNVASGIYFYEARTAGEVQINKMTLVK